MDRIGLSAFMMLARSFVSLLVILAWLPLSLNGTPKPDASAEKKEAVRGYLVDLVCVKEEAGKLAELGPNHTRKCLEMPACIQGGYGLLLASNEVLAFDERGNQLTRRLISKRQQWKGLFVKATGIRNGYRFHVLRIE